MKQQINTKIRNNILEMRKKLTPEFQYKSSKKICTKISELSEFQNAKKVAFYKSINEEVTLQDLIDTSLNKGKYCYLPVVDDDNSLFFLPINAQSLLVENKFKILEPQGDKNIAECSEKIDIIIVPLVAFNKDGARLGMGKGYYDRALANNNNSLLIGVAYEFQLQPNIKPQPWDVQLHAIVTEKNIYWSKL